MCAVLASFSKSFASSCFEFLIFLERNEAVIYLEGFGLGLVLA